MTLLDQAHYLGSLGNPADFRQFLTDWANGGAATHQITGANDQGQSTYEQVLADAASRGFDISGLAQHVTAPPAQAGIGQLDPAYEAYYQNSLNTLTGQRDAQLATNDYSRTLAQQRGSRTLGDLNQAWDQQRQGLPSDYIRRGVFGTGASQSGLYQQGLQDYAQHRGEAVGNATDAYNDQLRQYDLNASKINQDTQNRTLDLEAQRQARYGGQASSLANAKPFTV